MIIDASFAEELALHLLEINAVILRPDDPFTWSSGWKSPIYCDNRLTLRYPKIRAKIAKQITHFLEDEYPDVEVITGTATAGIPHAAWVAGKMEKPMAYVRSKAKAYGMGNQIEGGVDKGEKTVVIEDLISTGGSVLSVVEALKFIGADIQAVVSIFTYGFDKSIQKFKDANINLYTLTDYTTLVDVAIQEGFIDEKDLDLLSEWRAKPETWPSGD